MEEYTNILDEAVNATGLTAANQEKLNKFRDEELKKLQEKERLTSYDIEESKARLAILQQQIALEDAQKNKSNMRLRRDNQGNYTYQYTGDEEAIEEAENGGLTAKREWYELVKKRYKETTDWILADYEELQNLMKAQDEARQQGNLVRVQELQDEIDRVQQNIVYDYEEANKTIQDLYGGTATYFAEVNDANILPNFSATVSTMIKEWSDDSEQSFIGAVTKAIQDLETIQNQYVERTHVVLTDAGVDYQNLKDNGIDPTDESLGNLVSTNEELATQLSEVNSLLDEQEGALRRAEAAYDDLKTAAVDAITQAQQALEELARTAIETAQTIEASIQAADTAIAYGNQAVQNIGGNVSGNNGTGTTTTSAADKISIQVYREYGRDGYYYAWYKNKKYTTSASNEEEARKNLANQIVNDHPELNNQGTMNPYGSNQNSTTLKKYNRYELHRQRMKKYGYASGGYTGDWNQGIPGTDNGRFAILHQKELVLNESDTSNMLKAVEVLRAMLSTDAISKIGQSILNVPQAQLRKLSGLNAGQTISNSTSTNNTDNRTVIINADFSGVRSADEIYKAFEELQNYGLQASYSSAPHMNTSY